MNVCFYYNVSSAYEIAWFWSGRCGTH